MASTSANNRQSHIEVECKFVPNALLQVQLEGRYGDYERLRKLRAGSGGQQQASALVFFRLPDKEIKDKYVDSEDRLSQQGVWIRHRTAKTIKTSDFPFVEDSKETSEWQAKLRMGGDLTSSQMLETFGRSNAEYVLDLHLEKEEKKRVAGMAEVKTRRKTYVVQKPFGWHAALNAEGEIRVVLDEVTAGDEESEEAFKHVVGEVEMTADVAGGESDQEHDRLRRVQMARLKEMLDEFVARNAAIFPKEGVKGKLEAFFEWKEEREGFGALV